MSQPEAQRGTNVTERAKTTDSPVADADATPRGRAQAGPMPHRIKVYWHGGTWVFDDPFRGFCAQPVVARTPELIEQVLRRARLGPRQPFAVTFSDHEVAGAGYGFALEWVRDGLEGPWYRWGAMEGPCPALVRYFESAPKRIYCRVTARNTPFSVLHADRGVGGQGPRPW